MTAVKNNSNVNKMLVYYGFNTLEEFGISVGLYTRIDSLKMLEDMYEEDILWED